MASTNSSRPSDSTQFFTTTLPAPAQTTSLVEQQLRLSVESPQLLAAIAILLPLAKAEYRVLSAPRSSSCDPRTAELIKNEADAGRSALLWPRTRWQGSSRVLTCSRVIFTSSRRR